MLARVQVGAKLAGSYVRSMRWIAVNRKKEIADIAFIIDDTELPASESDDC
jgi:hypothetical protein